MCAHMQHTLVVFFSFLVTTSHPPPASPDHRHSSHHIHRPLSKLPSEGRRKKAGKKRRKDRDHRSSHVSPGGLAEEGEEEEEDEEADEGAEPTSSPTEAEGVKDVEVTDVLVVFLLWVLSLPPADTTAAACY